MSQLAPILAIEWTIHYACTVKISNLAKYMKAGGRIILIVSQQLGSYIRIRMKVTVTKETATTCYTSR